MNQQQIKVKFSSLATASIVLGATSLLCSIFTAIPAIICGHIALSEIKSSNGTLTGRGLALAGIIIGYVALAYFIAIIILVVKARLYQT